MKGFHPRRWWAAAAALVLVVPIAIAACGDATPEPLPPAVAAEPTSTSPIPSPTPDARPETPAPSASLELATAEGAARLTIPAGALPQGVNPSQVRITDARADDLPATFEGAGDLLAYRLEPDGLQLRQPATLEIRVENGGENVPVVWHVTSGDEDPEAGPQIELLQATEVLLDPDQGTATVRLEIDSFSWFVARDRGFFLTLEMARPFQATVGRVFPVHTTTTMQLRSHRSTVEWTYKGVDKERVQSSDPVLPWEITKGVFQPSEALGNIAQENSPGPTVVDGLIYTFNSGFSCDYAGRGFVEYRLDTRYDVRKAILTRDINGENAGLIEEDISEATWFDFMSIRVEIRCRDPQPTPTPTPSPTPTETPTPEFEQVTPSTLELGP